MLEELSAKLEGVLKKVRGQGKLTDKNIAESMKEIRRALLEADVNYRVVKDFVKKVQEKAVGEAVLRSVTPGQQIVKIVHDELVSLMGESKTDIKVAGIPPTIVMICGLQGSGKTTFTGKLGGFLRKKGRRPMLVAADVYRPAAKKQLEIIGKQLNLPVYSTESNDAVQICREAV
ncbi:MAG: signal recognition particle receptor subunit alpha, partial [Calditrichaeota bacterium]|nr:signal recognition particle receptor subunit alpha [Calditrichota bacterium]